MGGGGEKDPQKMEFVFMKENTVDILPPKRRPSENRLVHLGSVWEIYISGSRWRGQGEGRKKNVVYGKCSPKCDFFFFLLASGEKTAKLTRPRRSVANSSGSFILLIPLKKMYIGIHL